MQNFSNKRWIVLFLCILLCLGVGLTGRFFTHQSVYDWYKTLNKPLWTPPNWVFGPVWTTLYLLMGISLWLIWEKKRQLHNPQFTPYFLFGIQLLLNFLWSLLFFGKQNPLLALIDLTLLWVILFATIVNFNKYSTIADLLLVPYLIWISYAWALNLAIVRMN